MSHPYLNTSDLSLSKWAFPRLCNNYSNSRINATLQKTFKKFKRLLSSEETDTEIQKITQTLPAPPRPPPPALFPAQYLVTDSVSTQHQNHHVLLLPLMKIILEFQIKIIGN